MKSKSFLFLLEICFTVVSVRGDTNLRNFFDQLDYIPFASRSSRRFQPFAISPGRPQTLDETVCYENSPCASVLSQRFVSLDGTCNNRVESNRGKSRRTLKRFLPPAYADKKGQPRTGAFHRPLPSPRLISSKMSAAISEQSKVFSQLVPFWGQFIVHDIALTPLNEKHPNGTEIECECDHPEKECVNIPIPKEDIQFRDGGKKCFSLKRSLPVARADELSCDKSVRQQMNILTSYIDLGPIYGNDPYYLKALLDPDSKIGELREQKRGFRGEKSGLLPLQDELTNQTIANAMECPVIHKPSHLPCWVSGDIRANENSALVSQHTFWMRQHNKLVKRLHKLNPKWERFRLYKTARNILIAMAQRVTYEHFLPVLLGKKYLKRFGLESLRNGYYYGYDSSYDATVSNAFVSAAFRVGHSLIGPRFTRPNPSWTGNQAPDITLKSSFFNNEPVIDNKAGGPNSILRGLLETHAEIADPVFTNDMRNFLFAEPNQFGMDLLSINLQRAREHGIPGYIHYRRFCGLEVGKNFNDLPGISAKNRKKLSEVYRSVSDIDLYIGGLSEEHVDGGTIGPTFACIIGYQFRDMKRGDRFWYENGGFFAMFTKEQLVAIKATTYSRLLCDGIDDMKTVQEYPLRVASSSNPRKPCSEFQGLDIASWKDDFVTDYEHIDEDHEPVLEWTAWFPSRQGKVTLTSGEALSQLLVHRPGHVCSQVLDTETRKVNENRQVRYLCRPGTIKHNDFPPVLSEEFVWTKWFDTSSTSNDEMDDDESKSRHQSSCALPFAIQVQTTQGIPAGETNEVFETFSAQAGFVCRGSDQASGRCSDYRVRYLCRNKVESQSESPTKWSDWVSTDKADSFGDMEFLNRARKKVKVCRKPIKIEARTVDDKTPAEKTGDKIRRVRPEYGFMCYNKDQGPGKTCKDYEVRFLCRIRNNIEESKPVNDAVRQRAKQMCRHYNICC